MMRNRLSRDVTVYNLWVGGVQVTSEKLSGEGNVGNKGTWTFDPDTYTLALDNYNYNGVGYYRGTGYPSAGIYSDAKDITLTITLKGNNTITSSSGSGYPRGILRYGPLIIEDDADSDGIGRLNVHAEGNGSNVQSYGIYTEGDFTINGGIVNDVAYASRYYSYAVIVYDGDVIINGGSLIASGDTVTKSNGENCGIYLADEGHKVLVDSDAAVVTAAGYTSAIHGIVNNSLPAKGWADVAGTGEGTSIGTYSGTEAGYDFNNPPYNGYKKVQFEKSEYNLWVGGKQVTSSNRNNIPAANGTKSGTASYDPKTNTLTLDNYNYIGTGDDTRCIAILGETLNIKLKGESNIIIKDEDGNYKAGEYYGRP